MRRILRSSLLVSLMFCSASALAQPGPNKNGLVLWLKADKGLATDGSSWKDQSGNHHNAAALTGQAPTYMASGLNGLPVALFNGDQAMQISGTVLDSQTFTIIAVVTDTAPNTSAGFREIFSNWDNSTRTTSIFLGTLWTTATGKLLDRIRFTDAVGGQDQGQTGVGKIGTPTNAFILSGVSAVNNAIVRVGTKTQYQLHSGFSTRDLSEPWYLGRQGAFDGEYWTGDIAELLVYNKAVSSRVIKKDVAYLTAKWQ
jgi:hypothetical protein